MRSTSVSDHLIQCTKLRFVNAYLVREDDGFTLVDTTVGGSADDLIAAATNASGRIVRIVLTHGHGDHVGSVDALHAKLGAGVPVHVPELDGRILAGEWPVEGKKKGSWPKVTTEMVPFAAGDRIGSLEAIATPGHTPGHVSLLDTRDRSVIAGDAVATVGRVAVPSKPYWRFPLPALATWNGPTALESARALRAIEPTLLVAGHGPAVRNPSAALDRAIAAG